MSTYLSVLSRRRRLVVLLALLIAPLVYLFITAGGEQYEATAVVQTANTLPANVVGASTPFEETESRLATEIEYFDSEEVRQEAWGQLAAVGWTGTPEEVAQQVVAAPRGESSLLEVTGTAGTPVRAEQLTNAFVTAYVEYREAVQAGQLSSVIDDLETQRSEVGAELAALEESVLTTEAGQRDVDAAQSWYDNLSERIEAAQLRLSVDTGGVELLSLASAPEPATGMSSALAAAIAVMGGLLLAAGAALLADLLKNPVRTREEAQELLPAPMLGELSSVAGASARTGARSKEGASDLSVRGDTGLRLRIDRLTGHKRPRLVILVARDADEGEAVRVAAILADGWSRAGNRSAVVAAEAAIAGVSDKSTGNAPAVDGVGESAPGGRTPPRSASLIPREGLVGGTSLFDQASPLSALEHFKAQYDVVVLVDGRSDGQDTAAIAETADLIAVVCVLGRTPAPSMKKTADNLSTFDVKVDGLVLLNAGTRRARTFWSSTTGKQASAPAAPHETAAVGVEVRRSTDVPLITPVRRFET